MRERVLVVDDDDAIRRLVCPLLEAEDLDTECVKNGTEAIDALERESFAVVLLDLRMPAGDGFSVIEYLEKSTVEVRPIVLVISGYVDDRLEGDLASSIVTGVIRKPFDPTNLGSIVGRFASKYVRQMRKAAVAAGRPPYEGGP